MKVVFILAKSVDRNEMPVLGCWWGVKHKHSLTPDKMRPLIWVSTVF